MTIRFFYDKEVRTVWDENTSKWWYSIIDLVSILTRSKNPNNYWYVLKNRLLAKDPQPLTNCKELKLPTRDGRGRLTDCISQEDIPNLVLAVPSKNVNKIVKWVMYNNDTIDDQSKIMAYTLFENPILNEIEIGTTRGLKQIHSYIFGGLFDFAGQIRSLNISKSGFMFANVRYLHDNLNKIDEMSESSFDEIIDKYVLMNIAHPFREGNGRSTRIWLDLILKNRLKLCVDWSKINKNDYLNAMQESPYNSSIIKQLIQSALTSKINDKETFIRGIDYSYYYEQDYNIEEDKD
jgi:cell filamentation protein